MAEGVAAAETNENPVLGVVAVALVELKNDFAPSPAPLAEAKENAPAEIVEEAVEAPNPENTLVALLESPASLGVGLQMLRPSNESEGSAVAKGVGVLAGVVAVAGAAGLGSGRPVEVIVTLGAAEDLVVLPAAGVIKLKLELYEISNFFPYCINT